MILPHERIYIFKWLIQLCLGRGCPTLPCWLSQACATEKSSKESEWICKHMCNEGYLVN